MLGSAKLRHHALSRGFRHRLLHVPQVHVGAHGCDALGRYLVDPNDEDGGCAISTLLMSKNNMGEAAARSVLKAMRDQVTVTELDLSSNKVGGGGVGQSLAELLEDNTTLQVRPPPR